MLVGDACPLQISSSRHVVRRCACAARLPANVASLEAGKRFCFNSDQWRCNQQRSRSTIAIETAHVAAGRTRGFFEVSGSFPMSLFEKVLTALSPEQEHAASNGAVNRPRRNLMLGAGAVAIGLANARAADAAGNEAGHAGIDRSCRVSAARLDKLVADAYPLFNKPAILPAFDAKTHGARFDVDLHRLVTYTVNPQSGEKIKVSGLLALPVGASGKLPLVSWQHGTILSFDQVPSNLVLLADPDRQLTDAADSLETLFNVHRFAAQGYAVIAADYVGKGPFRDGRGEAYAVKDVTVRTCVDVLTAGEAAMRALGVAPSKLFLHGWSQGALNTQWLHQALRKQSRPIAATAVASPFNDLSEAWRFWAGAQTFALPRGVQAYPALPDWISLCMIVTLGSYELQYGLKGLMKSAIRPEFQHLAAQYWSDYTLDAERAKSLPTGAGLLNPGFFEHYTATQNSAFLRQLAANRATYWNYDSPIRFDYGLADEAIHPAMVYPVLAAGGSYVSGVAVPAASHRGTFLAGLYGDASTLGGAENILAWFDGLR
ncbi:alpha/beta hydrolase family protein [Burkholderia vietnamiensis]|uniref:alpha/beta hydrolase family protein n=1 Tax=Burkholderia vietnamiensis TaxID=60552 RepID=UPI001D145E13|nr:lipase family protein [Burkholderia vietnamiensis]UEC01582.1 lysophospholipase [Burkholderia vietnamiensis]